MAKSRPSIVDGLDLSPTTTKDVVVDVKAATPSPKPSRDIQHTSVYIPRAAYERLREIAFHERKKIHDLIMEGIDTTIAARGHSETARRKTTTS